MNTSWLSVPHPGLKADIFSIYCTSHSHAIYPSDNKEAIVLCVSSPQKKLAKKNVILESEQILNTHSA